ncbi:MAG: TonB-dependent receptor, partial [Sphingomonas bacterium]|uniref:TonB-dependent receptor n=1 Tax=Sphingomonas bacterium TaxID=1895847 RepID=UPI002617A1A1
MIMKRGTAFRAFLAAATVMAGGVALPELAVAQTTTAQLRGHVTTADGGGAGVGGIQVSARNLDTNQTYGATTDAAGGYTINGLRPGNYEVTASSNGQTATQTAAIGIGQSASLDLALGAATAAAEPPAGADIVVTANRLVEKKTSEVATNVSLTQIEKLPQTDRNFLSFAALAPGVRYNDSETDKGIQSGASTASQVNVFIDGVSLKNKLREGGIAGQQNSRGNPFGQLAVQEFRVLTQNYKAEYEQAGAAIVTAVTKSGTNQFHGEIFGQYTDKGLAEKDYINKQRGSPEPDFQRKQYGISLGGPIIKDKLFFFGAYEGNDQNRAFNVIGGGNAAERAAFELSSGHKLSEFEGSFVSPFRGDFYFGKLTFTPDSNQTFDLSYSRRQETDIQAFGNQVAFSAAENKRNTVDTYLFKWTYRGDSFVNEFSANYLNYDFNPISLHPDQPQFEYVPVMTFGGKDSTRHELQQDYTIRDDFTYNGLDNHVFKAGVRVDVTDIVFDD